MNWTTKKPTCFGWYWFQADEHTPTNVPQAETILRVDADLKACLHLATYSLHTEARIHIQHLGGRWAGPIPEPE